MNPSLHDAPEEYELPAVEAVLAGTLALMTGHAESACAQQRRRLNARVVDNLALLADHPQLTTPFRCAVAKLRCHWQILLEDGPDAAAGQPLRHEAPVRIQ